MSDDEFDIDDDEPYEDPDWCDRCHGRGRVTTRDYESYRGAMYKPCPECAGDPCPGEPLTSPPESPAKPA